MNIGQLIDIETFPNISIGIDPKNPVSGSDFRCRTSVTEYIFYVTEGKGLNSFSHSHLHFSFPFANVWFQLFFCLG